MTIEDYVIREAKKSEIPAIITFLSVHHFSEDPITHGFFANNRHRITNTEAKLMTDIQRKFVSAFPSLVAIHKDTDEIVSTMILVPNERANIHIEEKPPGDKSRLVDELTAICEGIYTEVNMNERFPRSKRALKLRSLAVHRSHRGKGLAKALLRESVEWAKRRGFDLVHSFFSLPAAKKVALASGLVKIADYDLYTVNNKDGSRAFMDISPNNVTSIMAMVIEE